MLRYLVVVLFVGLLDTGFIYAQEELVVPETEAIVFNDKNPKVAAYLSALVPGAGQFYNESYYKIPIIYGSFTSLLFFAQQNNQLYQEFLLRYSAYGLPGPTFYYEENVPIETLQKYKEYYRRNRDLLFIGMGFTYLLNILDAAVDAHLTFFDVGNEFAINVQPQIMPTIQAKPVYGLSFAVSF